MTRYPKKIGTQLFEHPIFMNYSLLKYEKFQSHPDSIVSKSNIECFFRYLEVVRAFARRHPHLSVAYQAQRSIEDEIERESEGDIKTVVCSYLIMLVISH